MMTRALPPTLMILGAAFALQTASAQVGSISGQPVVPRIVRQMTVSEMQELGLMTAGGAKVGEIVGVTRSQADGKLFLVIRRGGLLGVGGRIVALPLENVVLQDGRIVLRDMDPAQVAGKPEFKNETNAYEGLDGDQLVNLAHQP